MSTPTPAAYSRTPAVQLGGRREGLVLGVLILVAVVLAIAVAQPAWLRKPFRHDKTVVTCAVVTTNLGGVGVYARVTSAEDEVKDFDVTVELRHDSRRFDVEHVYVQAAPPGRLTSGSVVTRFAWQSNMDCLVLRADAY